MTREAHDTTEMTPFSLWIRKYCRDSQKGLSLTNLDYEFEDFRDKRRRKTMLMEEKRHLSKLGHAQSLHFQRLDLASRAYAIATKNDYWGFFLVQFSKTHPGDSDQIFLNGRLVTKTELRDHINFDCRIVEGLNGGDQSSWAPFVNGR